MHAQRMQKVLRLPSRFQKRTDEARQCAARLKFPRRRPERPVFGAVNLSPELKWRAPDVGDVMDVGHLYREVVGSIWSLLNRDAILLQESGPQEWGYSSS